MRKYVQGRIHQVVGFKDNPVNFAEPLGDKGLFGPDSVVWIVHSDFSSMLVGGVTALYLQMLHPQVLAGVWDHSNFREDLAGRLKRTAQFVSAVSFGPTADAQRALATIRRVHGAVRGHTEDGTPYWANDPALLLWVHATQCYGYVQAHQQYRVLPLSSAQMTQYLHEYQRVLIDLGGVATGWQSWEDLVAYLESQLPLLTAGHRVTEVHHILQQSMRVGPNKTWVGRLFLQASLDLVPAWGQNLLAYQPSTLGIRARRVAVWRIARLLRWASMESAAKKAQQRVAVMGETSHRTADK